MHVSSGLSIAALAALIVFSMIPAAMAQPDHCDPEVEVSGSDPLRYSSRGARGENSDRCEGSYRLQVASQTLQLASFTLFFEEFDPEEAETLIVRWDESYERPVRLRATGLRDRLYYQMDTVRPKGTTSFHWPTGVLSAYDIRRKDIGLLGWTRYPMSGSESDVYVPLRIASSDASPDPGRYQFLLMPVREMEEVYVSLAEVDAEGRPATYLIFQEPLRYGYYPAQQTIDVEIPADALQTGGVYHVELSARYAQGGSTSIDFLFHHPE